MGTNIILIVPMTHLVIYTKALIKFVCILTIQGRLHADFTLISR